MAVRRRRQLTSFTIIVCAFGFVLCVLHVIINEYNYKCSCIRIYYDRCRCLTGRERGPCHEKHSADGRSYFEKYRHLLKHWKAVSLNFGKNKFLFESKIYFIYYAWHVECYNIVLKNKLISIWNSNIDPVSRNCFYLVKLSSDYEHESRISIQNLNIFYR